MIKEPFNPFQDYCTSWPDTFMGKSISYCCYEHDNAYAAQIGQTVADLKLAACVAGTQGGITGYFLAAVMLLGVSVFGAKFYPKKTKMPERDK